MARVSKVVARKHEAEALAFKVANPQATYKEVADHIGVKTAQGGYAAVFRPLKNSIAKNASDMQALEGARYDAMLAALMPFALNDIQTVLQWIGKGRDCKPVECEGHDIGEQYEHSDEGGRQVCYVIPSLSMIQAIDKATNIVNKKVELFGLRHSDGLAQRQIELQEAQTLLIVGLLKEALEDSRINISNDVRALIFTVIAEKMRATAIDAKAEAI